jgi:hypothetical protein
MKDEPEVFNKTNACIPQKRALSSLSMLEKFHEDSNASTKIMNFSE